MKKCCRYLLQELLQINKLFHFVAPSKKCKCYESVKNMSKILTIVTKVLSVAGCCRCDVADRKDNAT